MMFKKITFFGLLFLYLSPMIATPTQPTDNYFKKNQLLVGFYDDNILPSDPPRPPHPLFWNSRVSANYGLTFLYERTIYHTQKYFAANVGTSTSWWALNSPPESQVAISAFVDLYIFIFRTSSFSPYITYSVAGPTILSRRWFGNANLGSHFIFQDFFGLGVLMGKNHTINMSFKLYHYSNGDLFLHNDGFDVPLIFSMGYSF